MLIEKYPEIVSTASAASAASAAEDADASSRRDWPTGGAVWATYADISVAPALVGPGGCHTSKSRFLVKRRSNATKIAENHMF